MSNANIFRVCEGEARLSGERACAGGAGVSVWTGSGVGLGLASWVIHYTKALEPVGQVEFLFISHRGNFLLVRWVVYLELLGKLRSRGLASTALHPFVKGLDPPAEARQQNWERGLGGAHQVSVQLETWAANSFSSGFWHKRNNGEPLPKSIPCACLCLHCHGLRHGIGFWWSPHLFSSLSARLLPSSLPNWPRASLPHLYGGKFQSNSECASSQCFVIFFFF